MKITQYSLPAGFRMRIAVTADFHARSGDMKTGAISALLEREKPDMILAPGDFFNNTHEKSVRECYNSQGLELLSKMADIAPVYYSIGNHEHGLTAENREILQSAGVTVLDNEIVRRGNLAIAGLTSGYTCPKQEYDHEPVPDLSVIPGFTETPGYRILLCHHPEYWSRYLSDKAIDLTVSGHAHGGQWRIGSRGVYAPGQGLFPKYVGGLYHGENGTLCVSRGMRNTVKIPRFFNPCEIVILDLI